MNKKRINKIAIGFIVTCTMIFASVIAVAANLQATHGINVVLNGQQMQFADDMQPFTMEGRTFLPQNFSKGVDEKNVMCKMWKIHVKSS